MWGTEYSSLSARLAQGARKLEAGRLYRRVAQDRRGQPQGCSGKRHGFVVPHDPTRFPGAATPLLQDEFVDLIDVSVAPADALPA